MLNTNIKPQFDRNGISMMPKNIYTVTFGMEYSMKLVYTFTYFDSQDMLIVVPVRKGFSAVYGKGATNQYHEEFK